MAAAAAAAGTVAASRLELPPLDQSRLYTNRMKPALAEYEIYDHYKDAPKTILDYTRTWGTRITELIAGKIMASDQTPPTTDLEGHAMTYVRYREFRMECSRVKDVFENALKDVPPFKPDLPTVEGFQQLGVTGETFTNAYNAHVAVYNDLLGRKTKIEALTVCIDANLQALKEEGEKLCKHLNGTDGILGPFWHAVAKVKAWKTKPFFENYIAEAQAARAKLRAELNARGVKLAPGAEAPPVAAAAAGPASEEPQPPEAVAAGPASEERPPEAAVAAPQEPQPLVAAAATVSALETSQPPVTATASASQGQPQPPAAAAAAKKKK